MRSRGLPDTDSSEEQRASGTNPPVSGVDRTSAATDPSTSTEISNPLLQLPNLSGVNGDTNGIGLGQPAIAGRPGLGRLLAVPRTSLNLSDSDDDDTRVVNFYYDMAVPDYDGTHGAAYLKFKNKYAAYLSREVLAKGKTEDVRIMLFTNEVTLAMRPFTAAAAWFGTNKAVILHPEVQAGEPGFVAGTLTASTALHMYNRLWTLADDKFSKATKADLLLWHQLKHKPDESPAAFGERFSMYCELVGKLTPIPTDWTVFVARLDVSIAEAAQTAMDLKPVAEQNLTTAIQVAESLWHGRKYREFINFNQSTRRPNSKMDAAGNNNNRQGNAVMHLTLMGVGQHSGVSGVTTTKLGVTTLLSAETALTLRLINLLLHLPMWILKH